MSFFLAFDTYLHNIFTSYAPVSREISYTQRIGSKIIATFLQFFLFLICSAFTSFLFLMVSSFTNFLFIFLVCQNFNLLQKIISLRRVRSNTARDLALAETIESRPLCITDLFLNKSVAYLKFIKKIPSIKKKKNIFILCNFSMRTLKYF
jgi:hypothetical protein